MGLSNGTVSLYYYVGESGNRLELENKVIYEDDVYISSEVVGDCKLGVKYTLYRSSDKEIIVHVREDNRKPLDGEEYLYSLRVEIEEDDESTQIKVELGSK